MENTEKHSAPTAVPTLVQHRVRCKISEELGWSKWSGWRDGFAETKHTDEIEIEIRSLFTAPPAISPVVTREDAISFLEGAVRNWSHVPQLSEDDVGDVATELLRFLLKRLPHAAPKTDYFETYYERQIAWSRETFGPALRTKGVIDHIRKELVEIEADPFDLAEWLDVAALAMDGYWRHGGTASDILGGFLAKQTKNFARKWPDYRNLSEDDAVEHDRSQADAEGGAA